MCLVPMMDQDHQTTLARPIAKQLLNPKVREKNLVHRMGHGAYAITDPFVKQVWLERQAIKGIGAPGDATPPAPSA